MDIDAVGIPDPEGHSRHTDDWRSSDGKTISKASACCSVRGFEDHAPYRNITYEVDPLEARRSKQQRARHGASSAGTSGKPPAHLLKFIQDVPYRNINQRRHGMKNHKKGEFAQTIPPPGGGV